MLLHVLDTQRLGVIILLHVQEPPQRQCSVTRC